MTLKEMRNITIDKALKKTNSKAEAAKLLCVTERTLYNYLKERKECQNQ